MTPLVGLHQMWGGDTGPHGGRFTFFLADSTGQQPAQPVEAYKIPDPTAAALGGYLNALAGVTANLGQLTVVYFLRPEEWPPDRRLRPETVRKKMRDAITGVAIRAFNHNRLVEPARIGPIYTAVTPPPSPPLPPPDQT